MKFLALTVIGMLFLGCANKRNATREKVDKNETTKKTMDIIKVKAEVVENSKIEKSDPFTIDTIEIRGNIMYIDVTYSGGCEAHEFSVIGSPFIAKSMPAIRGVQVLHNANSDSCEGLKKAKLEVYIDDLAYEQLEGSSIYLTVQGWKERILYTYQ